jgi:hypothetical protein
VLDSGGARWVGILGVVVDAGPTHVDDHNDR